MYLSLIHMIEERGLDFLTNRQAVDEQPVFSANALPLRTPLNSLEGEEMRRILMVLCLSSRTWILIFTACRQGLPCLSALYVWATSGSSTYLTATMTKCRCLRRLCEN